MNTKPRNSLIAFFLSLFLSGLGQVYNGQIKKAIIFFSLPLLFAFLFGLTHAATSFYGLFCLLIIEIGFKIYVIIDAVKNAKRQSDYHLKPYNTWYYHSLIAAGMLAFLMGFDTSTILGVHAFNIPTTSNNPTIQFGDMVVADTRAYKNNEPDYGDLVIFSRPDGQFYTYRVVGRPHDTIALIDNVVSINGNPGKGTLIKELNNDQMPVMEFEEELPNGHKHLIYKSKILVDSTKANIKSIVVPPNSYYLLGDNRDNALDSRYEGFVSKDRIKGRIIYSCWGRAGATRMNIDFRKQ